MSKMSIIDAAEHFGVSKEAIHNRIRRGSLKSIVEDGVKMVIVDESTPKRSPTKQSIAKATLSDDRYYKLLEEQNSRLQSRVEVLEGETRSLRDQKEQMLIEERIKIENIYKEKDEQLKTILSSISSQFMLGSPQVQQEEDVIKEIEEHVEAEIEVAQEPEQEEVVSSKIISLKKYLKKENFSIKKQEKIFKRFKKREEKEERIIIKGKKYFIDLSNYSYEDIIK